MKNIAQNFSACKGADIKTAKFYNVYNENITHRMLWYGQMVATVRKTCILHRKFYLRPDTKQNSIHTKILNFTKQIIVGSDDMLLKCGINKLFGLFLTYIKTPSGLYVECIDNNQRFIYFHDG